MKPAALTGADYPAHRHPDSAKRFDVDVSRCRKNFRVRPFLGHSNEVKNSLNMSAFLTKQQCRHIFALLFSHSDLRKKYLGR
jgi:hypothetical protein